MLVMELLNSGSTTRTTCATKPRGAWRFARRIGPTLQAALRHLSHADHGGRRDRARSSENHRYFAHYHTGGVPGTARDRRNPGAEYPAIMRAIVETGYKGTSRRSSSRPPGQNAAACVRRSEFVMFDHGEREVALSPINRNNERGRCRAGGSGKGAKCNLEAALRYFDGER